MCTLSALTLRLGTAYIEAAKALAPLWVFLDWITDPMAPPRYDLADSGQCLSEIQACACANSKHIPARTTPQNAGLRANPLTTMEVFLVAGLLVQRGRPSME